MRTISESNSDANFAFDAPSVSASDNAVIVVNSDTFLIKLRVAGEKGERSDCFVEARYAASVSGKTATLSRLADTSKELVMVGDCTEVQKKDFEKNFARIQEDMIFIDGETVVVTFNLSGDVGELVSRVQGEDEETYLSIRRLK